VVQRYGADVTGGSESLARALAERLNPEGPVTVFTTCARDYVTWADERPAGESVEGGVLVRRFPVEETRDLAAFNRFAEPLYTRATTRDEEVEFLRRQGPLVPSLVGALEREKDRFRAVLFFTYLYYPAYWGLLAAPERAILVPTAHDEPPLRFSIYRELFARARAFAFLAPAEEDLVRSRFEIGDRPALVAGMGVEAAGPDVEAFRRAHHVARPYAVYAGRIDAGKGCAQMLEAYARYRAEASDPLDLLLLGRLSMAEPRGAGVRCLGFLPEADKAAALAGATVVLCPSPYESLSIVLLEGFAQGVPGIVNARSAVLREHCQRSGGGLYYQDEDEFVESLLRLSGDAPLRQALGEGGHRYVQEHYRWEAVLERYRFLIRAVSG
jgi:glycosyltransferase involved in cell wall biosynthesis